MFWRNPNGSPARGNWPKCNACLKGEVVDLGKIVGEAKTNEWLHVLEIKQPQDHWKKGDPDGCWMPLKIQQFVLEEVSE